MENKEDILEEALRLTREDRQNDYGDPSEDFERTAKLWSAFKGVEFDSKDVAMFMILLKVSRLRHKYKKDSLTDIIGYSRCLNLILEKENDKNV